MGYGTQNILTPAQAREWTITPIVHAGLLNFGPRHALYLFLSDMVRSNGAPEYRLMNDVEVTASTTLEDAIADGVATSCNVADASGWTRGDVIEFPTTGERAEITDHPNITNAATGAATLTIRRGVSGTPAAVADNAAVRHITISATGAETDQRAVNAKPVEVLQYAQTFQQKVEVGGGVLSNTFAAIPFGVSDPYDHQMLLRTRHVMNNVEKALIYGTGEANTVGAGRAKMKGVKTLSTTNKVTSPTNANAYKAADFTRDMFQSPIANTQEEIDTVFVGTDFITAFEMWKHPLQRYPVESNILGVQVNAWQSPMLMDATIYLDTLLQARHAFGFNRRRLYLSIKRAIQHELLARTGDHKVGQVIGELSLGVDNPAHMVWLEGITTFAA